MAQIAKMEVQTEMKSSADKVYDIFRNRLHLLPKICPQLFKDGKVVQGDWNTVGSVIAWYYTAAGNNEGVKQTIEGIDEESKTITYNRFEGDAMKYYQNCRSMVSVTGSDSGQGQGSSLKWTMEFEKVNDTVPDPTLYIDFLTCLNKGVDAYLLNLNA